MSETPTPRTDGSESASDYVARKLQKVVNRDNEEGMYVWECDAFDIAERCDKTERELTAARAELAKAHRRIHGDDSEDCVFCASKKQTPGGDDPQCCLCALEANMAALRAEQAKPQWLPIESAPRDGTVIQLGNEHGSWLGYWEPIYPSGYRPYNPWTSLMLNHRHMKRPVAVPTHWMPLPAPPRDLREGES